MNRKAFTLIELLVVIAIIALLLSIIMPALKIAKEKASGAVCINAQHQLMLSSTLYAGDNDDRLVQSDTNFTPDSWVQPPQDELGNASIATIEDRKRGCERGALFPYTKSVDFYHCPGDRRIKAPESTIDCAFRSYSIHAGLNSWWASEENEDFGTVWRPDYIGFKKLSKVKSPSSKISFVEEAETTMGYNHHSWAVYITVDLWYDPLSVFHNDSSTIGFVDGHAENHKWREQWTIEFFSDPGAKYGSGTLPPQPDNEDLQWLQAHSPYERLL